VGRPTSDPPAGEPDVPVGGLNPDAVGLGGQAGQDPLDAAQTVRAAERAGAEAAEPDREGVPREASTTPSGADHGPGHAPVDDQQSPQQPQDRAGEQTKDLEEPGASSAPTGSGGQPSEVPAVDPLVPSAAVLDRPLFHVEPKATASEPPTDAGPDAASGLHVEQAQSEGATTGEAGAAVGPVPSAAPPPEVALPQRPHRPLPRILAVANQKGGVGKTTTAVNLGAALAELGYRTLVVDLDPQGNATTGLGINAQALETSVYDVLMRELPIEDALEPTSVRNLFVVPATIDLAGAEIELVPAFSRELRLKRALDGVADDFDFTLIDCPPSLGLLTVNALAAADEVVVPVQCEYYALEGLSALLRNVQLVQNNLNKALEVSTIILTMYDARTKLAEQVAQEVRSHFGNVVCRNLVPRTVRLSEAPSYGQPIIVFDPTSRGAIAYRELAKEVSGGSPQRIG